MRSAVNREVVLVLALSCLGWGAFPTKQSFGAPRAQGEAEPARLTYTKMLAGSTPEFEEITVDLNGSGSYDGRKLSSPPNPRPLQLSPATTQRLFALAHALNDFKSIDLESHKNVANLGRKTFTYEEGGQKNRVEFNYSLRREAQELADLFEKIGSVQEHIKTLEFATKYDPLSLPQELLQIQIELNNKALADPEMMAPVLRQITRNSRFLHLAQARARDILERMGEND
ncbi:MAG TPA: hypothetical protein VGV68_09410 [Terriglobia bacterium]|nr:hypothetical protein [Terriglobia bacterium]